MFINTETVVRISSPFFCKLTRMNIKKKYIGSKVFHPILRKFILIEKGNEEKYEKLGLDIFTQRRKPKLQKNDKDTKKRNDNVRGNGDGIDNNIES